MGKGNGNGKARIVATAADLLSRPLAERVRPVDLEDGRRAFVRIMTLEEFSPWEKDWSAEESNTLRVARIIVATACDPEGNLLFRPDQIEEVARTIGANDGLNISTTALRVNRFTPAAVEPLKNSSGATIASD